MNTIVIIAIILLMLLCERISILRACASPAGREWIRTHTILHPNTLSILRIPMGLLTVLLAYKGLWSAATVFFAFWMITDLTDGTIARRCDLGTDIGKWLDPLSDKCMYFPVLIFCAFSEHCVVRLNPGLVFLFIVADIIGQTSRLFVKKKAANQFGKAKTALTTILLSVIAINQINPIPFITPVLLNATMLACLLLAILSAYCKIIPDRWYANTFTLMNFLCGCVAIWQAFHQKPFHCVLFVVIGQFFDLFDGRLARKYGSTKQGPIYDDIADATSFGIGIGSLIYVSLDKLELFIPRWVAIAIAIFYVLCLFYRLYRFLRPTIELPPGVFQGLPSPAGAMLAGSAILVSIRCDSLPWTGHVAAILVVCTSVLMVSNVKYSHFGQIIWPSIPRAIRLILLLGLILACIIAIAHKSYQLPFIWGIFLCSLFYLIYGIHAINRLSPPVKEDVGSDNEAK